MGKGGGKGVDDKETIQVLVTPSLQTAGTVRELMGKE